MLALLSSALGQWAEDEDPALAAAQEAWNGLDALLVAGLLLVALLALVATVVAVLRERGASWRRRLVATGLPLVGCTVFALVLGRMGVVWLVAAPAEGGGPLMGSGLWWIWCLWLFGSAVIAVSGLVAAFIVVGAEDL
jgi:hypothetical protein